MAMLSYRKGITETVLSKSFYTPYSLAIRHTNEGKIMESERFITGQKMLQQVDGKGGEAVVESLKDIAPDFARYLLEFPFGDITSRSGPAQPRNCHCRRFNGNGQCRPAVESAYWRGITRWFNAG